MIFKRHWIIAGILAMSVHAAGFYGVFYGSKKYCSKEYCSKESGSQHSSKAARQQGIEFDLSMMGNMAALAKQNTAPQKAVKVQTSDSLEKVVKKVLPEPVVGPKVESERIVAIEPAPVTVKQVSPIVVPKVKRKPELKKVKHELRPHTQQKKTNHKSTKHKNIKHKSIKHKNIKQKKTNTKVASLSKDEGLLTASQKVATGTVKSKYSGSNQVDKDAKIPYITQLAAALSREKHYPRAARRHHEEGVVTLFFIVHKNGSVSDVVIRKSSGSKRLDRAVLAMIRNAIPLPTFPRNLRESQLSITLPVAFKLSEF